MQGAILRVLARIGLAFVTVASATVLMVLLARMAPPGVVPHLSPFVLLAAVLGCSWVGGYPAGIACVCSVTLITQVLLHRPIDPYRLALLTLVSVSVSWIAAHRRRVESDLRARVAESTAQLTAAVAHLQNEIHDRKAAEEEVRRLNLRLEQRIDERTRQLEVSNHELESFSYSVSHDLRAPLRSIDGFTRILLGTSAHKLDPDERALFERVLNATSRMNALIEDLLNLARVARSEMHAVPFDLSAFASGIAGEISRAHPEIATSFIIQPGIQAICDSGLIEVVLRNLIDNAWKFSSKSADPTVEFGSTLRDGSRVLYVRDNGVGFDPEYQSKLFAPFQRLHRQEEFPGTGIGLATVLRIIQRHGGWIQAESQPGKGATFYFTLAGFEHVSDSPVRYLPDSPNSTSARVM